MALKHLEPEEVEKEIATSKIPVLIDFWAEWCGPCRQIAPIFEELSKEYDGKIQFAKFDVEKDNSIPAKYGILGIPCMIMFYKGQELDRIIGALPRPYLKQKIEEISKKAK